MRGIESEVHFSSRTSSNAATGTVRCDVVVAVTYTTSISENKRYRSHPESFMGAITFAYAHLPCRAFVIAEIYNVYYFSSNVIEAGRVS
ncbi:MAG TPA: hypothetical protein VN670_08720 [Acidobacteriaceae bacterium]|nr:hypothetical protein [Acidobacteriaceae bacterium]